MPSQTWLKNAFPGGYRSGAILSLLPGRQRLSEELKIGGSYRRVFQQAIRPHITSTSTVMELGPGAGDWTRAILEYVKEGQVITLDFQDVAQWLRPEQYGGRLICIQVTDNSFDAVEDDSIDFFWSMGVLCHNNLVDIEVILANALKKMKRGGISCHQHGDWEKLDKFGWKRGKVPVEFQKQPDDEIWWPRNCRSAMVGAAERAGWAVVTPDLDLLKRDGLILLRRP